jgi:hypothetical protein
MRGVIPAVLAVLAGCSDESRYQMTIEQMTAVTSYTTTSQMTTLEADLIGGNSRACLPFEEPVRIVMKLDAPGTVGPELPVVVTDCLIEYFYYDPTSGGLAGPVNSLSNTVGVNLRVYEDLDPLRSNSPLNTFTVPVATRRVKAWAVGNSCQGIAGYGGGGTIQRMMVRVTVRAEDATGKKVTAEGTMLMYLYDYSPHPLSPGTTDDTNCYTDSVTTYWGKYCP